MQCHPERERGTCGVRAVRYTGSGRLLSPQERLDQGALPQNHVGRRPSISHRPHPADPSLTLGMTHLRGTAQVLVWFVAKPNG